MDLTLRNGLVWTDGEVRRTDVGIEGSTVAALGDLEPGREDLDVSNHLVLPGFVNAHTHASMTIFRGFADDLPFEKWLHDRILPVEAELTAEEIRIGAALAAVEMIKSGTTAFGDMYHRSDVVADVVERTGLKAAVGSVVFTDGIDRAEAERSLSRAVDRAREIHGTADGRLRALITPHAPYSVADWALEELAAAAADLGAPLHIHLNETQSEVRTALEATGTRPTVRLSETGIWEPDGYVAHGIHLSEDEIEVLSETGTGVAHCPAANMKLATGAAPVRDLLEAGVTVGLGTDGPGSNNNLDMVEETKTAALLGKLREEDASALPAETVLEMATRNGAELLGFESGLVEPGRPADLVAIDLADAHLTPRHDLLSHVVYSATGHDVATTIVDGSVLYHDGVLRTLEEAAIYEEADSVLEFFESAA